MSAEVFPQLSKGCIFFFFYGPSSALALFALGIASWCTFGFDVGRWQSEMMSVVELVPAAVVVIVTVVQVAIQLQTFFYFLFPDFSFLFSFFASS